MMIGTQVPATAYRQVIARGFDHATMRDACRSFSGGNLPDTVARSLPQGFSVPAVLRDLARAFVDLQEERHTADYNLARTFTRAQVLSLVLQVEHAFGHFDAVADRTLKKFFLACLWAWKGIIRR